MALDRECLKTRELKRQKSRCKQEESQSNNSAGAARVRQSSKRAGASGKGTEATGEPERQKIREDERVGLTMAKTVVIFSTRHASLSLIDHVFSFSYRSFDYGL